MSCFNLLNAFDSNAIFIISPYSWIVLFIWEFHSEKGRNKVFKYEKKSLYFISTSLAGAQEQLYNLKLQTRFLNWLNLNWQSFAVPMKIHLNSAKLWASGKCSLHLLSNNLADKLSRGSTCIGNAPTPEMQDSAIAPAGHRGCCSTEHG